MALIDEIDTGGELQGYHLLHAARADLLRRAGRHAEASAYYERALRLCENGVEIAYLERRLRETRTPPDVQER
jgi:RNA polymerase sigma-70 factor (ECF subfamily)